MAAKAEKLWYGPVSYTHLVYGFRQVFLCDDAAVALDGAQRGFVDEVGKLCAGRAGGGPVSYTHLDVYKRQCWTVRPEDDINAKEAENDAVIFEFYHPAPKYK